MPDISKCFGAHCEVKESCYRYTAPSNDYWQSYISPNNPGKDCGYYWRVRRMRANILLLAMLLSCGNAWAEDRECRRVFSHNLMIPYRVGKITFFHYIPQYRTECKEIARKMPEPNKDENNPLTNHPYSNP